MKLVGIKLSSRPQLMTFMKNMYGDLDDLRNLIELVNDPKLGMLVGCRVMKQIIKGLVEIWDKKEMHFDLKPPNFLFCNETIKKKVKKAVTFFRELKKQEKLYRGEIGGEKFEIEKLKSDIAELKNDVEKFLRKNKIKIKIADLGSMVNLNTIKNGDKPKITPHYTAPELIPKYGDENQKLKNPKADVWSAGMTLVDFLGSFGDKFPLSSINSYAAFNKISCINEKEKGGFSLLDKVLNYAKKSPLVSKTSYYLLEKMLTFDDSKRPSPHDLLGEVNSLDNVEGFDNNELFLANLVLDDVDVEKYKSEKDNLSEIMSEQSLRNNLDRVSDEMKKLQSQETSSDSDYSSDNTSSGD